MRDLVNRGTVNRGFTVLIGQDLKENIEVFQRQPVHIPIIRVNTGLNHLHGTSSTETSEKMLK